MSWRYLPPVHSPVTAAGLLAGVRALLAVGGDARRRLADLLQADLGAGQVVLTDSGTSALALAIRAAVTQTGRGHVALPGYACYDLVTAVNAAGAGVVLYDVDPNTLGPDWNSFRAALQSRPAAAVVVHLFGVPVDLDRARDLASAQEVPVIEDAAQAAGGRWQGRPLGSFGGLAVLSFGRGKGVTGGAGGALLAAPDWPGTLPQPDGGARGAGDLARLVGQVVLARPLVYRIPAALPFLGLGQTVYHEPWPAAGISAGAAAVAARAWSRRESDAGARARVAAGYLAQAGVAARAVRVGPEAAPGWLRFPVLLGAGQVLGPAAGALGVLRTYPLPLRSLPALPSPVRQVDTPGADRLAAGLVTLPTHRWVAAGDMERMANLIQGEGG